MVLRVVLRPSNGPRELFLTDRILTGNEDRVLFTPRESQLYGSPGGRNYSSGATLPRTGDGQVFVTDRTLTGNEDHLLFPQGSQPYSPRGVDCFAGGNVSSHMPRQLFLTDCTLTGHRIVSTAWRH